MIIIDEERASDSRFVERTAAAGAKQSGDLRTDRHAVIDCGDADARICHLKWSDK